MQDEAISLAGVRITSPDKVLYPEQGITKEQLARYALAVSDVMLPHVALRPITLVRCPTGRQKKCFYQRHAGSGVPEELSQTPIPGFEEPYLYIRDTAGLVALVQMGVLEIHPWNAKVDRPDLPDRIIFDLDPGEGLGFQDVVAAAHETRAVLLSHGLESFAKTTGGRGVHVVVPIERRHDWTEAKGFARALASQMAEREPDRFLMQISKAERRGRIFIDYLRNDPTSTAVAPYSTRARPGAPVSMPLAWENLTPDLDPASFNLQTVPGLVAGRERDPWARIGEFRQTLPKLDIAPSTGKRVSRGGTSRAAGGRRASRRDASP
jgi:bifunctional non-homologous end joining protein LigD